MFEPNHRAGLITWLAASPALAVVAGSWALAAGAEWYWPLIALALAPLVVGACVGTYYLQPFCPGCGRRWSAYPCWEHANADGTPDRRRAFNRKRCSRCGFVSATLSR